MKNDQLKIHEVIHPFVVNKFRDGEVYKFPRLNFSKTNLYMAIAFVDEVFIKLPSQRTAHEYYEFLRPGVKNPRTVRALEPEERFEHLEELLKRYPEFLPISRHYDPETAHYLIMYKIQHQRLKEKNLIQLPETRFVVVEVDGVLSFGPAVIQSRVQGTNLLEMYDEENEDLKPGWRPYFPTLSEQFSQVISSELRNHIDWNIRNFIFCETDHKIYYIDVKPSTLFGRVRNEENLEDILELFHCEEMLNHARHAIHET